MKKVIIKILLGFLFAISPLFSQDLLACSCLPLPSVYEAFNRSKAVFTGKILSSKDLGNGGYHEGLYQVELLENFKGVKEKNLTITAGLVESSCFWGGYEVGESYLIYAHDEKENILKAENACTRTSTLPDAESQIFFIRELLKGKPESQVYGSVAIVENDLQTNELKERPLPGSEVTLKSGRKTFKAITDKNGVYRFENISQGSYKLQFAASAKHQLYFPFQENFAVLKNKKICRSQYSQLREVNESNCYSGGNSVSNAVYMDFTLRWNNEIKGKILDGEGKIVDNGRVRLLPLTKAKDEFGADWIDKREKNEDYSVIGKTPGQYVVAVELDSPLGVNNKLRFFYPQTTSVEKAKIFNITETTQLKLDFKLPEGINARRLTGEIWGENGRSVGGFVWITLDSMEDAGSAENRQFAMKALNPEGRFAFDTLEGEEYWLHFWGDDFDQSPGKKKVIRTEKIKIGKEETPRKFIVTIP